MKPTSHGFRILFAASLLVAFLASMEARDLADHGYAARDEVPALDVADASGGAADDDAQRRD